MKNIFNLFTIVNFTMMRKLTACVILACIMLGSIEFVPARYDFSFMKTVTVSSYTIVNHFFSLSTVTMNIIVKLFSQNELPADMKTAQKQNENKRQSEKTSTEASNVSILPASFVTTATYNKMLNNLKFAFSVATEKVFNVGFVLKNFCRNCKEGGLNIMLLMMMMFLIKRHTSSDNYGNIKLNNSIG